MATSAEAHTRHDYALIGASSQVELFSRLNVEQLCKGWMSYRDNSEWAHFRALFAKKATVWTTWSGAQKIDDFIDISKQGKDKGIKIAHRENGTIVELNYPKGRAVGKMKATITQRVPGKTPEGGNFEYEVDNDCRFLFFCSLNKDGRWETNFVKLIYEKDKVVPVNGATVPQFSDEELAQFPDGYKYLGAAQERLGYTVDKHLATLTIHWERMYECMEKWLDGAEDPGLFWETEDEKGGNGGASLTH